MIPALLDHLLQSTLFAGAVALIALALRNSTASLRFWLWLAASLKFLVPFALLTAIGERLAPAIDAGPGLRSLGEAAERFPTLLPGGPVVNRDLMPVFDPAPWLLGFWAIGFLAILGLRLGRWRALRAVLRTSRPLPSIGPVPIRVSRSVLEPGLFGVTRPVVVLPEGLANALTPDEVDTILAHEAAHWRRGDNLWAAIHMLVEALVWFHPAVWWIGRRMIAEREEACDDAVVQHGHRREVYARAILETCRLYLRQPLGCVAGASGADLTLRVEAIMTAPPPGRITARQTALLLFLGVAVLATPLLSGLAAPEAARAWLASLSDTGPTPAQIKHDLADQKRPRAVSPFDPARFDAFVGDYQAAPYAIMTVTRRGGRFFTQVTSEHPVEVYPEGAARFFGKGAEALQISFQTGLDGRITGLVQHEGGINRRLPRLTSQQAADLRARLARRLTDNRPSLGTEAYVRRWVASMVEDRLDTRQMGHALKRAAEEQWPRSRAVARTLGPFKGLKFLRVSPMGADLYEADFQNHRLFIRVEPLVRGKEMFQFWRLMD